MKPQTVSVHATPPAADPARPQPRSQPQGCTNFKLRQLLRSVARLYDAQMAAVGLKTSQYSLLSHVLAYQPLSPSALATHMGMDASTLTRNLRPLLDQGLVVQGPGADGRTRSITLTESGRARQAQAKLHWKRAQLALNAKLGDDSVAALHAMIDAVQGALADDAAG
jgi:DNA-binding MarR family transcriptional regulator